MRTILLSTILCIALPATASTPGQLQGQWTGREDGPKNAVSIYFQRDGIVFVDKKEVLLGTWKLSPTTDGKAHAFDVTFNRISDHAGKSWIKIEGSQARSLGLVQFTDRGIRLCLGRPGSGKRATLVAQHNPEQPIVRCFDLSRPSRMVIRAERPKSQRLCIRQCIMDNQMRAVSPQMIEADCRKDCSR
jgi:hypothetical protein